MVSVVAAVDAYVSVEATVAVELPAVWCKRRKRRRKGEFVRGAEPAVDDPAVPGRARLNDGDDWTVRSKMARR